jgi:hypothetical protein
VEEDVEEEDVEEQEEEEQEEHPDVLACRPCGLVDLTPTWVGSSSAQHTVAYWSLKQLSSTASGGGGSGEEQEEKKVVAAVDIHDCLYVCIGDDDDPARSSRIRTRVTVAEVTGWRFTFPPRGTCQFFRFAGKRTGNVSPPFRQRPDRQRTAIVLLFISNPSRRHRHLRFVLPVLLQMETSRNGAAGHSERPFHH